MEILFTPWRYPYLIAPKPNSGCIFCAASTSDMTETQTLFRGDSVLVMLNRYPYSNGHLMIAPFQHRARLYDTPDEVLGAVMRMTAVSQRILSDVYHPNGFNIGMNFGEVAGAGVADHYHVHVVPRWNGDSNFMTVTAGTRLVPEDLGATYAKLLPYFEKLGSRTTE